MADSGRETVISLTSYPPRFPTLALTVQSLLEQNSPRFRTVLFVGTESAKLLPHSVTNLVQLGLEIVSTTDFGPFTKLIPALEKFPDWPIVTADDDVIYPPGWLQTLITGHRQYPQAIICHRAHRVSRADGPGLSPYEDWDHDVQDVDARLPSHDLLATGIGGVLYPPHSLHSDVSDVAKFRRLCPTGDDLWFHWMAWLSGTQTVKVGPCFSRVYCPGSQEVALWRTNKAYRNDEMIAALVEAYGSPGSETFRRGGAVRGS